MKKKITASEIFELVVTGDTFLDLKEEKVQKEKASASAAGPAQVEIPPFVFLAFACCVYIAYFVDEQ